MKSNDWLTQQAEMLFADFIQDIAEKHPEATAKEKEKLLTERLLHAGWILGNIIDEVNKQASYADAHMAVISLT